MLWWKSCSNRPSRFRALSIHTYSPLSTLLLRTIKGKVDVGGLLTIKEILPLLPYKEQICLNMDTLEWEIHHSSLDNNTPDEFNGF